MKLDTDFSRRDNTSVNRAYNERESNASQHSRSRQPQKNTQKAAVPALTPVHYHNLKYISESQSPLVRDYNKESVSQIQFPF